VRWQKYFDTLDRSLRSGSEPTPIDWFALGDAWSHGGQPYADRPVGNSYAVATRVAHVLQRGGCP